MKIMKRYKLSAPLRHFVRLLNERQIFRVRRAAAEARQDVSARAGGHPSAPAQERYM
jgi:hypothetical protein